MEPIIALSLICLGLPIAIEGVLLTTKDVAARLGVSIKTVQSYIQRGQLPAEKLGRDYVIREEDINNFKERRRRPGRPRKDDCE